MSLPKSIAWLPLIIVGLAGCAGLQPPPGAPNAADILSKLPASTAATVVNIPPGPQHQTLPDFLGITRCCYQAGVCCETIRAEAAFCFPALAGLIQPGAGIPAPGDLGANPPASVQAASDVKAKEAQAQAKIEALRFLADFGCGCYNEKSKKKIKVKQDGKEVEVEVGEIEFAFYDALGDCTEEVRFEALKALRKVATQCHDHHCCGCNEKACCSELIQNKVRELAYDKNDMGCFMEPSERVRRLARIVLCKCGPVIVKPQPVEPIPPKVEIKERKEVPTDQPGRKEVANPLNGAAQVPNGTALPPAKLPPQVGTPLPPPQTNKVPQ
jgi:hypothetical protein